MEIIPATDCQLSSDILIFDGVCQNGSYGISSSKFSERQICVGSFASDETIMSSPCVDDWQRLCSEKSLKKPAYYLDKRRWRLRSDARILRLLRQILVGALKVVLLSIRAQNIAPIYLLANTLLSEFSQVRATTAL